MAGLVRGDAGMRRRVLATAIAVALAALTAGWSTPASAATATTFVGTSGSYVDWFANGPFRVPLFSSRSIGSASKGDFFGIAMVADATYSQFPPWFTLTQARNTPCAFAGSCTRDVDPQMSLGGNGIRIDPGGMVVFSGGWYRVAMLGVPGATVTVQLPVNGRGKPITTSRRGRLAVAPVPTSLPRADPQQPAAEGSVLLDHTGTTISVMAIRFDTAQAVRSSYGYCVSGGPATEPWLASCNNGASSATEGATIDYETCPVGPSPCAPVDAGSHTATIFLGDVRDDRTFYGFDTQTVAASSRVTATVMTLAL